MGEQCGDPFLRPVLCGLPHTAHSLGHAYPALRRARARSGDVLLGLYPFLPDFRRRSLSRVQPVHRDSGAVRPLQAVHGRRTAFRLRGPVSVEDDPRQPGGLPVLGPVASRRAWVLRLRRADEPLASQVAHRVAFPLGGRGRRPGGDFRSSITPPADALVYASGLASRREPARLRVRPVAKPIVPARTPTRKGRTSAPRKPRGARPAGK